MNLRECKALKKLPSSGATLTKLTKLEKRNITINLDDEDDDDDEEEEEEEEEEMTPAMAILHTRRGKDKDVNFTRTYNWNATIPEEGRGDVSRKCTRVPSFPSSKVCTAGGQLGQAVGFRMVTARFLPTLT